MKSIDILLGVSCKEVADFRFVVFLVADGDGLSGAVVVVIEGLVPGGLGEECAVVEAVGGGHAVYGLGASLAVGEVHLLFYLINIEDIPTFRKIRYRYIVSHL